MNWINKNMGIIMNVVMGVVFVTTGVLIIFAFTSVLCNESDYITTYHIYYGNGDVDTVKADYIFHNDGTVACRLDGNQVYYLSNALNLRVVVVDSTKKVK